MPVTDYNYIYNVYIKRTMFIILPATLNNKDPNQQENGNYQNDLFDFNFGAFHIKVTGFITIKPRRI